MTIHRERLASGLDLLPAGNGSGKGAGLRTLLLHPERAALGRRNRLSNFTFFLLAAAGGSAASVVAALLAIWALLSVSIGRLRWRIERPDRAVIGSMLLFFAVLTLSSVYHGVADGHGTVEGIAKAAGRMLPFVYPLFLVPRMRCSLYGDTLPPAFKGAAVGGLLLIPISILSYHFDGGRAAGLAGNAGPLSICGLLALGWSLLALSERSGAVWKGVALFGGLGGALAVILSGMRGAWPALPLILIVVIVARRRSIARLWRDGLDPGRRLLLCGLSLAFLGAAGYILAPAVGARIAAMMSDLALIAAHVDSPTSLNLRRTIYEAASEAFLARPVFGYGPQAHWTAIVPYMDSRITEGFSFSHLHNIVLTIGIDAGLIGIATLCLVVAAPVWTAWRARGTSGGGDRLAAAWLLVIAFLVPGLSNIMFFHDILDAVWAFSVSLIAASVPVKEPS